MSEKIEFTPNKFYGNCIDIFGKDGLDKIISFLNVDYCGEGSFFEVVSGNNGEIKFSEGGKEISFRSFSALKSLFLNNHESNMRIIRKYYLAYDSGKSYLPEESTELLKDILVAYIYGGKKLSISLAKISELCKQEVEEIMNIRRRVIPPAAYELYRPEQIRDMQKLADESIGNTLGLHDGFNVEGLLSNIH